MRSDVELNKTINHGLCSFKLALQRLNWLKEAMESLAANDPVKKMLKDVEILLKDQENDVETREMALEDIQTLCEDLDLANGDKYILYCYFFKTIATTFDNIQATSQLMKFYHFHYYLGIQCELSSYIVRFFFNFMNFSDFHKVGGFQILPTLLRSEYDGLRWRTADLVGTLVQNNPYCQEEMLKINLLPLLLEHLDDPTETNEVRIKCLYAISCEYMNADCSSNIVRTIIVISLLFPCYLKMIIYILLFLWHTSKVHFTKLQNNVVA